MHLTKIRVKWMLTNYIKIKILMLNHYHNFLTIIFHQLWWKMQPQNYVRTMKFIGNQFLIIKTWDQLLNRIIKGLKCKIKICTKIVANHIITMIMTKIQIFAEIPNTLMREIQIILETDFTRMRPSVRKSLKVCIGTVKIIMKVQRNHMRNQEYNLWREESNREPIYIMGNCPETMRIHRDKHTVHLDEHQISMKLKQIRMEMTLLWIG